MLTPRLNSNPSCGDIPSLLQDIDCKLTSLAKIQYTNIVFALGKTLNETAINDLLNYKRILTYRYCNSEYAEDYTLEQIAGKVKLLIFK